jgi:hypothetical protein
MKGLHMSVPPSSHPNWAEIIHDQQNLQFDFFVTKILLGRLNSRVRLEPEAIDVCIEELRQFFLRHEHNPKVIADLNKIFN